MTKIYKPVDTDLVDNLEHFAIDQIHVHIAYVDHTGLAQEMRGKIAEVFTQDHQEFLKMADSRTLRLDQITKVQPDAAHFGKAARKEHGDE